MTLELAPASGEHRDALLERAAPGHIEQRGLADAGRPLDEQRTSFSGAHVGQQVLNLFQLPYPLE